MPSLWTVICFNISFCPFVNEGFDKKFQGDNSLRETDLMLTISKPSVFFADLPEEKTVLFIPNCFFLYNCCHR